MFRFFDPAFVAFALCVAISSWACGGEKNPGDRGSSPTGDAGMGGLGGGGSNGGVGGASGSAGSAGSFPPTGEGGPDGADRVVEIAVGPNHICALLERGNVRCWGHAKGGQLGYGNPADVGRNQTPASVGDVDIGAKAVHIAVGDGHSCALLEGGRVRCWGLNISGELGYGHVNDIGVQDVPASAGDVNVGGNVVQIAAGNSRTCALLDEGTVRCWGFGGFGALGYANTLTIGDDETPASAGDVNVGGTVVQIAVGDLQTCALLDTGAVRCWGYAEDGELGYSNNVGIGDDEAPAKAGDVDVGGAVVAISAGGRHTCALLDGGRVRCWGQPLNGELGYGNTTFVGLTAAPSTAGDVPVGGVVKQISASSAIQADAGHTCALLDNGHVRCWGFGLDGQLGYGNTNDIGDDETPASVGDVDVGGTVIQVSTGGPQTCALLEGGHVRCWGRGILGYGSLIMVGDNETPASAGDVPVN